jgi:riboflavin kinase/FMN adenylyltransferase
VSSSAIRRLLAEGQMEPANRLLGYTYYIEGVVTEGYQMGRRIGFPTANLLPDEPDKLVPADGVYAVRVQLQCNWWNGVLNIGHRPTLHNGPERSIEVHLLDFKGDVYALPLRIEFLHYLRREQMFASVEELAGQIELDKQQAKQYFIVNEDI